MLTGTQMEIVAYAHNGSVICRECAEQNHPIIDTTSRYEEWAEGQIVVEYYDAKDKTNELETAAYDYMDENELSPLSHYELDCDETWNEEGLWCDNCSKELIEPTPEEVFEEEDTDEDERNYEVDRDE